MCYAFLPRVIKYCCTCTASHTTKGKSWCGCFLTNFWFWIMNLLSFKIIHHWQNSIFIVCHWHKLSTKWFSLNNQYIYVQLTVYWPLLLRSMYHRLSWCRFLWGILQHLCSSFFWMVSLEVWSSVKRKFIENVYLAQENHTSWCATVCVLLLVGFIS